MTSGLLTISIAVLVCAAIILWGYRQIARVHRESSVRQAPTRGVRISGPSPRQTPLGTEAIDLNAIARATRPSVLLGSGEATQYLGDTRRVARRTEAFGRSLFPAPPRSIRVSTLQSAENLVTGLAGMAPVTLFLSAGRDAISEDERIIVDIFDALDVTPKCVDVSSDETMHLGLPRTPDDVIVLPAIYIDGVFAGDAATILEEAQNGALARRLAAAGIRYDESFAEGLRV